MAYLWGGGVLIFGGAYVRREICVSKSIELACSEKERTVRHVWKKPKTKATRQRDIQRKQLSMTSAACPLSIGLCVSILPFKDISLTSHLVAT